MNKLRTKSFLCSLSFEGSNFFPLSLSLHNMKKRTISSRAELLISTYRDTFSGKCPLQVGL